MTRTPAPRPATEADRAQDEHHDDHRAAAAEQNPATRRALLAGLLGAAGVAAAACTTRPTLGVPNAAPGAGGMPAVQAPPPPPNVPREVATTPAVGAPFPDRDASYVDGAAPPPAAPPAPGAPPAPVPPPAPAPAPGIQFAGAAEAARNTPVTVDTLLDTTRPELHLLRRATFGPTQADVDAITAMGIDAWLAGQLAPETIDDGAADALWRQWPTASMSPSEIRGAIDEYSWDAMFDYAQATLSRQVSSRRQLFEVMVDLMANHLNVTMPSDGSWNFGTSYHNEVIRAHAMGSFLEMLLAAMRHPAMLRYLNNNESHKDDVNENLGRELLELHTVGVGGGYTEEDVRNSAYILTGRRDEDDAYSFDEGRHYEGPVTVLGFTDPNESAADADAVGTGVIDRYVSYLATHPATAQRIARKIAVRFVSDDPPQSLVDRLAQAYTDNGTQLRPVLEALFRSSEFWSQVGQKTRRPLENVVASARILGVGDIGAGEATTKGYEDLYWSLQEVGHQPLNWGPPNGYPDVAAAWPSSGAMLEMWNRHRGLVQGWWEGLKVGEPTELVQPAPPTVGEYVPALCDRLALQRFRPEHEAALVTFLEKPATASSDEIEGMVAHVAPLVLDSPYFALR